MMPFFTVMKTYLDKLFVFKGRAYKFFNVCNIQIVVTTSETCVKRK